MRQFVKKQTCYTLYDGVQDAMDQLGSDPAAVVAGYNSGNYWFSRKFCGREGIHSWDDVRVKLSEPWTEGREALDRMKRELDSMELPEPKSRKRRARYSEDNGDEVDMDRLRSGQPYWRNCKREITRQPQSVTILFDMGIDGGTSWQVSMWRCVAAVVLTEKLEAHGFRVELHGVVSGAGVYTNRNNPDNVTNTFQTYCLKKHSEPLDVSGLVNSGSALFLRTVIFANFVANGKQNGRKTNQGLGSPRPVNHTNIDAAEFPKENRILISHCNNKETAAHIVRDEVKKFI